MHPTSSTWSRRSVLALAATGALAACSPGPTGGSTSAASTPAVTTPLGTPATANTTGTPLIVFFSRAGENYVTGGTTNLTVGHTEVLAHLEKLLAATTVVPAVNQIEVHPYFQQREVQSFGAAHGILTQAWSPIGGITHYRDGQHTSTLQDPAIVAIGEAHHKSAAQVMLRWHLQHGVQVIPKSVKPARIAENIDVFDFELTSDEMAAIDGLDTGTRGGPEPEQITMANFGFEIPEA